MTNGDRLNFIRNVFLPASIRTARTDHTTSCQSYKTKPPKTTTTSPLEEVTVVKGDDWSPIWEFLPNAEKDPKTKGTYQVIVIMLCIGFGFLIFMIVTIRILYNMFKFKQGNDDSFRKVKKATRKRKRTSSVISRRASRASSILSTRSNWGITFKRASLYVYRNTIKLMFNINYSTCRYINNVRIN